MHNLNDPSFFFTNNIGTPQGEVLDLINPLSNKSCSCAFNSFSSAGAIRYGAIDMGFASKMSSMLYSTFFLGDKLGNSLENTSVNFFTTGIY